MIADLPKEEKDSHSAGDMGGHDVILLFLLVTLFHKTPLWRFFLFPV